MLRFVNACWVLVLVLASVISSPLKASCSVSVDEAFLHRHGGLISQGWLCGHPHSCYIKDFPSILGAIPSCFLTECTSLCDGAFSHSVWLGHDDSRHWSQSMSAQRLYKEFLIVPGTIWCLTFCKVHVSYGACSHSLRHGLCWYQQGSLLALLAGISHTSNRRLY